MPLLLVSDEVAVVLVYYRPACPATIDMAVSQSFATSIHGFILSGPN
jgi:hypothetical protein